MERELCLGSVQEEIWKKNKENQKGCEFDAIAAKGSSLMKIQLGRYYLGCIAEPMY